MPAPKSIAPVKFPLVVKLLLIMGLVVALSATAVNTLATWYFAQDAQLRAEDYNLTVSEISANRMEAELKTIYTTTLLFLDILREKAPGASSTKDLASLYFERNPHIAFIAIPNELSLYNSRFFLAHGLEQTVADAYLDAHQEYSRRASLGESLTGNATPYLGLPATALFNPYTELGSNSCLVIIFSSEMLQSIVSTDATALGYAVNHQGDLIAHPDYDLLKLAVNMGDSPLVSQGISSSVDTLQVLYNDKLGKSYFGAFRRLSFGQFAMTSSVAQSLVQEASDRVIRQNLYLTSITLLIALLLVWFFSRSISRPVLRLVKAVGIIEQGQFDQQLQTSSHDEIGLLTQSINAMSNGLAERERIKETFGKFVNRKVAEQALTGHLALGGERKHATIFFSDIRSFTAISERLAPEQVVEFLNEYLSLMVSCIEESGGVVDKFIGDAIMAVWGTAHTSGSPTQDARAALKASLAMRQALLKFNQGRGDAANPVIQIGCGLNTGPCLAGQIGSAQRMEYTAIGDTVNLASRIEALNKPFCTDILISSQTYELLKEELIVEAMPAIKVKGKVEALQIYALINFKNDPGPQSITELRQLLGLAVPKPAQEGQEADDEVKYQILP